MPWARNRGYGSGWDRLRRFILERDGFECQIKGKGCTLIAAEVDHIIPKAEGGSDDLTNLRGVCQSCHERKSKEEKLRGIERRKKRRYLPEEEHPAYRR